MCVYDCECVCVVKVCEGMSVPVCVCVFVSSALGLQADQLFFDKGGEVASSQLESYTGRSGKDCGDN